MVYEGFLRVGGVEVVNTERARGYLTTADCPINWIVSDPCPGLAEALGDDAYLYTNVSLAPWYDESLDDLSSRFFGVVGLRIGGTVDSTRGASKTEGIEDGGVIGRTRKGMRDVRVRATLMAQGRDALDYGTEWLSSVFDGTCSQHGAACETTDAEFMSDCPPERGTVPTFTDWVLQATNAVTSPSFEVASASRIDVRRNLIRASDTSVTTGWTVNGSSGALTSENGRLKYVANGTNSVRLGGQTALASSKPAGDYTVSYLARASAASLSGVRVYLYDSPTATIRAQTPATAVASGERRYEWTLTATGVFDTVYMEFYGSGIANGDTGYISEPILEVGTRTGLPWFNGTRVPRMRQNWNTNPRLINNISGWAVNGSGVTQTPTPDGMRIDANEGRADGGLLFYQAGTPLAAPGQVWSGAIDIYVPDGYPALNLSWQTRGYTGGTSHSVGSISVTVQPGQTVRVSASTAALAATADGVRNWMVAGSGGIPVGARFYVRNAILELAAANGPYFDGTEGALPGRPVAWEGAGSNSYSYMYDGDLTVLWTGTVQNSESTLGGLQPAGLAAVSGVAAIRSSWWAKSGAYSLRLIPISTNNVSYVIIDPVGTFVNRGTAIATRHQEGVITGSLWTAAFGRIYWNPTPQVFSAAAANAAGDADLRVYATPAGVESTIVLPHGGTIGSGDVWYDAVGVFDGTYDLGFFDGDTPSDDLNQYTWTGTPGQSASTWEIRQAAERPRTNEEYAALVDPLRRFMHDVAVTSGPLEVEIFQSRSGDYWGRVIEFTISSERAWIYGLTKELALNPALPSVVQDAPYNLIPYPSAEQNDLTSPTTRWIDGDGPVGSQLIIPTHVNPPGGQTTHPSVVDFGGSPFGGYRYWMAHTPYPGGNDAHEDPNIVASNDGTNWVIPAGLTNPIDNQPGSPGAYNSDVDLVYGPDNMLWLFWRTYDPAATGAEEKIYLSKSTNGTTWTAKTVIWQTAASANRYVSPSFIYESGAWTMYAVNIQPSTPTLVRVRSTGTTLTTGGWNAATVCSVTPAVPAGRQLWHIEVRLIDGQYIALLNDCTAGASGTNGDLYLMVSTNGTAFTRAADVAIPRTAPMHSALYRATMVKKSAAELDVWYAGWVNSPSIIWNVFRTTITAPQYGAGVTVSTNLSTNPGVEVDATGWVAAAGTISGTAPTAFLTNGRSTDIGAGGSTASFRQRLLGDNGATVVSGAKAQLVNYQAVAIPAGTNRRISLNLWTACLILNGSSPGTVVDSMRVEYEFFNGGSSLGAALAFGFATAADFGGKAYSLAGLAVPATATEVRVRAVANVTWTSSATAAQNSDIRLYADALTVSIP